MMRAAGFSIGSCDVRCSCAEQYVCYPSQFLDDFPAELVEEWNVGNEDLWADDEPF